MNYVLDYAKSIWCNCFRQKGTEEDSNIAMEMVDQNANEAERDAQIVIQNPVMPGQIGHQIAFSRESAHI